MDGWQWQWADCLAGTSRLRFIIQSRIKMIIPLRSFDWTEFFFFQRVPHSLPRGTPHPAPIPSQMLFAIVLFRWWPVKTFSLLLLLFTKWFFIYICIYVALTLLMKETTFAEVVELYATTTCQNKKKNCRKMWVLSKNTSFKQRQQIIDQSEIF